MVFVYARGPKEVREHLFVGEGFDGERTKANAESGERRRTRKAVRSIVKTSLGAALISLFRRIARQIFRSV